MPISEGIGQSGPEASIDLEPGKGFWEYPEDIQVYGISAATNLFGWSTSAEFSYTKDSPVQINGNDLVGASVLGIGPSCRSACRINSPEGTYQG
jgi:hypothetical protein